MAISFAGAAEIRCQTGLRPFVLYVKEGLWRKLSAKDRSDLSWIISNIQYDTGWTEGRRHIFPLESPILIKSHKIFSLKTKGLAPKIESDGTLPRHKGDGYFPVSYCVEKDGTTSFGPPDIGSPEGGTIEERCVTEFLTVEALGPKIADHAFGYGIYPHLKYKDKTLGFVILGLEDIEDLRFYRDFISRPEFWRADNPHLLTWQFGATFDEFHKTHVHGSPHLDNIGIIIKGEKDYRVRIRDLDYAIPLVSITPAQRYAYLFLDFAVVFSELIRKQKDCKPPIQTEALIYPFLQGHFGRREPLPFEKEELDRDSVLGTPRFFLYLWFNKLLKGERVNIPDIFSRNPRGFIQFMHQKFLELSGMSSTSPAS